MLRKLFQTDAPKHRRAPVFQDLNVLPSLLKALVAGHPSTAGFEPAISGLQTPALYRLSYVSTILDPFFVPIPLSHTATVRGGIATTASLLNTIKPLAHKA